VVIANDILHHDCDYTPYEGMRVRGWPAVVLSRGEVVVERASCSRNPGRAASSAAPARRVSRSSLTDGSFSNPASTP
jgi:hypothetical protein